MEKTIFVVTDIHYISSAVHHFNDAFLSLMAHEDGKMTILSDEIMHSLVHYVIDRKPDAFVVTGDLSWNGDITSHHEARRYLMQIQNAGIPVYVIPGNHDIGKEREKYYAPFCSVLPQCADLDMFASIYAPFMHQDDPDSLSYCIDLNGLRMVFVDVNGSQIPGTVSSDTLSWMDHRLSQSNTPCIAFSHQNFLVLHPMFAKRRITNGDALLRLLAKHHISIGFSGHSHLQRIAQNEIFSDICTACLSAYEHHIGVIQVNDEVVNYHTENLPIDIPCETAKKLGIYGNEDERQYFLSSMLRMVQTSESNPMLEDCVIAFFAGHPFSQSERVLEMVSDTALQNLICGFQLDNMDMNKITIHT